MGAKFSVLEVADLRFYDSQRPLVVLAPECLLG